MGIKKIPSKVFDLEMSFSELTGKLLISTSNAGLKSKRVKFIVNDEKYDVDFDANGTGVLEFDKSTPSQNYIVRIESKGTLVNDQRICFSF